MTAETRQRYGDAPLWSPARPQLGPVKLLLAWLLTTASLMAAAWVVPGASIESFWGALLVVAVVGVLNAFLPPLIAAVRLPFALVLGFLLVLAADAAMLMAADALTEGTIKLDSFWTALLVALLASAVGVALDVLFRSRNLDGVFSAKPALRGQVTENGRHFQRYTAPPLQ